MAPERKWKTFENQTPAPGSRGPRDGDRRDFELRVHQILRPNHNLNAESLALSTLYFKASIVLLLDQMQRARRFKL